MSVRTKIAVISDGAKKSAWHAVKRFRHLYQINIVITTNKYLMAEQQNISKFSEAMELFHGKISW